MRYIVLATAFLWSAQASASATIEYLSGTLNAGESIRINGTSSGKGQIFTVNFSRSIDLFFDGVGSYNYYEWDPQGNRITADTYPVYDYGWQNADTFSRRIDGAVTRGSRPNGSTWLNVLRYWSHYDIYNRSDAPVDFTGSIIRYAAVPEPASWALMISGFAFVGAAVRRRPSVGFAGALG